MKKTAVLLAGLLLVSGTVFAEGWEVSEANIESTFQIMDTETGMNFEEGDVDLNFAISKELKEGVTATIELASDENDETDMGLELKVVEGDFTAQFAASWYVGDYTDSDTKVTNTRSVFGIDKGDGAYIAWNVMGADVATLTVYPYETPMEWDEDTFEAFKKNAENPGFKVSMDLNEDTTVAAKWTVGNGDKTTENINAFKAELSTKLSGISLDAYLGLIPEVDNVVDAVTAFGAKAEMTMDTLTFNAEFNSESTDSATKVDKVGLYAKAALAMAEVNEYKPTAYASFKSLNDDVNENKGGAYTELEGGVELNKGSFTVTPKIVIGSSDEKVYGEEEEGANKQDAFTTFGVKLAYEM